MAQTNRNIRIDEADKMAFAEICGKLGTSMSTPFNIFAKTVIRQQRIPFEVGLERPNAETLATMEDVNHGRNRRPPLQDAFGCFFTDSP